MTDLAIRASSRRLTGGRHEAGSRTGHSHGRASLSLQAFLAFGKAGFARPPLPSPPVVTIIVKVSE